MALDFSTAPLFIIFAGTILIALIALTMRAVVRRERAMIDTSMDEPHEIEAYQKRWRNAA